MNIIIYLIGFATALVVAFIINKIINRNNSHGPAISQSYINEMYGPFLTKDEPVRNPRTQTTDFEKKNSIPVILLDGQAFWILNNTLFVADQINGMIDSETTRPVDTMGMDKVQLDKTIFIVEALTEGAENDNWNSGNKSI